MLFAYRVGADRAGQDRRSAMLQALLRTIVVPILASIISITCLAQARPNHATTSSAKTSSPITQEQADAILKELKAIRADLEARPPGSAPQQLSTNPPRKNVDLARAGGRSLGSNDAPLVLVEFSDYQCPFCKRFHEEAFKKLKSEFVDTGKVRYVSFDLPLSAHPDASNAAQAARCALDQNKFWEMRESLEESRNLSMASLNAQAKQTGVVEDQFRRCMESHKHEQAVIEDQRMANAMSIAATPSFILGKAKGQTVDGELLVGAIPFSVMRETILTLLEAGPTEASKSKATQSDLETK